MCLDVPYFSVLLCLTPDDFTRQVENAATQWVKGQKIKKCLISNTICTVTCTSKVKEYRKVNIAFFGHVSHSHGETMRDNCMLKV